MKTCEVGRFNKPAKQPGRLFAVFTHKARSERQVKVCVAVAASRVIRHRNCENHYSASVSCAMTLRKGWATSTAAACAVRVACGAVVFGT